MLDSGERKTIVWPKRFSGKVLGEASTRIFKVQFRSNRNETSLDDLRREHNVYAPKKLCKMIWRSARMCWGRIVNQTAQLMNTWTQRSLESHLVQAIICLSHVYVDDVVETLTRSLNGIISETFLMARPICPLGFNDSSHFIWRKIPVHDYSNVIQLFSCC